MILYNCILLLYIMYSILYYTTLPVGGLLRGPNYLLHPVSITRFPLRTVFKPQSTISTVFRQPLNYCAAEEAGIHPVSITRFPLRTFSPGAARLPLHPTTAALRSWLRTTVPTPFCLCTPFSCKACPET